MQEKYPFLVSCWIFPKSSSFVGQLAKADERVGINGGFENLLSNKVLGFYNLELTQI